MNAHLLGLYHRLPPQARSLAASFHGRRLHAWRYGPQTEALVEAALSRERWPQERLRKWQQERLRRILEIAATQTPYYRRHWLGRGDWSRIEDWPLLGKEPLRAFPSSFLIDYADVTKMQKLRTSGTTGAPLDLWATQEVERQWWALFEARWRRWYGVSYHDRWAVIGGKPVTPIGQNRPPYWVWDSSQQLLYLSTYHLSPHSIGSYLDEIERRKVRYLRGYSSSLYSLAEAALRLKRKIELQVVITYAEVLYDWQREAMAEAFQCPVRETYGMVEMTAAASECEHGRMHLWPEAGYSEILADGVPAAPGQQGDLIATGLLNDTMPLVRYRVGDTVTASSELDCPCGRTLPLLGKVEGRLDDMIYTPDGRRFGCLDVVHAGMAVREAQVIQDDLDHFTVRYVPAPEFTVKTAQAIVEELQSQLGRVKVDLVEVPAVPRGANGKFRMIECHLPPEVRRRLDTGGRV